MRCVHCGRLLCLSGNQWVALADGMLLCRSLDSLDNRHHADLSQAAVEDLVS